MRGQGEVVGGILAAAAAAACAALAASAHAGEWGGAELIGEATSPGGAPIPQVAMDGSGCAMAVFNQSDGTSIRLYARRWDGASWGEAVLIDAGTGDSAGGARVAMDGSGTAMAVFEQSDGTDVRICARRWNGSAWSSALRIDTGSGHFASSPQVAMDGNGGAMVVFSQSDGEYVRVYANRWTGGFWTGAVAVDAATGRNASSPRVAMDGNGEALVLFEQSDGTAGRIYARRWRGSFWSSELQIDAGTGRPAYMPYIAMNESGAAVAVFSQSDGVLDRIYARRWNGAY